MTYKPGRLIQNYQTLATDTSQRTISTSVEIYDNTEIEYTPPTGAKYVVYVANFNSESKPDRGSTFSNTRLQESTDSGVTWSDIDGCKIFESQTSHMNHENIRENNSYTFILDAWSGARRIRLAGRSHSTTSEYNVNSQYLDSDQQHSAPMVSIYSVMETNL